MRLELVGILFTDFIILQFLLFGFLVNWWLLGLLRLLFPLSYSESFLLVNLFVFSYLLSCFHQSLFLFQLLLFLVCSCLLLDLVELTFNAFPFWL